MMRKMTNYLERRKYSSEAQHLKSQSSPLSYSRLLSVLNEAILACVKPNQPHLIQKMTRRVWYGLGRRTQSLVKIRIHGRKALVNAFNNYPFFARQYPYWNMPLVELVHQAFVSKARPIHFVDVGAATGDTIFLLEANCPGEIASFLCVEGDSSFFPILEENISQFSGGHAVQALLSSSEEMIPSLVRTHSGTASAQGGDSVSARTFDSVVSGIAGFSPDVIKVDTDGYDGKVLAGARTTLKTHRPLVIFEWHPILCQRTNNPADLPFQVLTECGYTRFLWFDKNGLFSHASEGYDSWSVSLLEEECLSGRRPDWHFDVIALGPDHVVDTRTLSDLRYSQSSPSRY